MSILHKQTVLILTEVQKERDDLKARNAKLLWALEKIAAQGCNQDDTLIDLANLIDRNRLMAMAAILEEKKDN